MWFTEYLELCVVEQKGDHTLGFESKSPTQITLEEETFLKNVLSFLVHKVDDSFPKEPAFVHVTRDCQVIETGNHIARYTVVDCLDRVISFYMTFGQDFEEFPKSRSDVSVVYYENKNKVWSETLPKNHPSFKFFPESSRYLGIRETKLDPDACIVM